MKILYVKYLTQIVSLWQVNILFSSLEEKIEIVVKRVEIFKESPKDLRSDSNIDNYLTNFCKVLIYFCTVK